MSVLTHTSDFAYGRARRSAHRPGLFRRVLDSLLQWRQRRVEQEIASHFGLTDGYITDEIERRISERLMSRGGFRG